jgi:hypothetical protein
MPAAAPESWALTQHPPTPFSLSPPLPLTGHHGIMPLVRKYKYAYNTRLEPIDMTLAERRGEGPCPQEYGSCLVLLTDIEFLTRIG